jgi:hypothetical protein
MSESVEESRMSDRQNRTRGEPSPRGQPIPDTVEAWKVYAYLMQDAVMELEQQVAKQLTFIERVCGDGCHCMAENNKKCFAVEQEKGNE